MLLAQYILSALKYVDCKLEDHFQFFYVFLPRRRRVSIKITVPIIGTGYNQLVWRKCHWRLLTEITIKHCWFKFISTALGYSWKGCTSVLCTAVSCYVFIRNSSICLTYHAFETLPYHFFKQYLVMWYYESQRSSNPFLMIYL